MISHNFWYYIFYLISLENMNILDYDGKDLYIIRKMKEKSLSWFPINRSKEYEERTD